MSTNISSAVIASMFKHLTFSYSPDEARDILVQKYPQMEGEIYLLEPEEITAESKVEPDANELKTAVKQKMAEAKTVKPPKDKKVSKRSQARELYANATDKSRKAIVTLFVKELDLTEAAASAYYYSVKK